uniref:Acyl-CoA synthetase short-chain family member 3, mitochondrial n=2 Tax=Timema TaxID=61471 RepID=A0A7R9ECR1_9NEOP|nr:unnamed protein product [Timema monikensis]
MLLNLLALSNVGRWYAGVSRLAGALADLGVGRGDRVLIYMPLIPEAIIAMLATARLGAIHSVVFGGFAARELCARIEHAEPKIIIAASCGVEPNKVVSTPDRYSNLDLPVIGSLAYCKSTALDHAATEFNIAAGPPGSRTEPNTRGKARAPFSLLYSTSVAVKPYFIKRGILNEAIAASKVKPKNCIIFQRYNVDVAELEDGFDILWEDAIQSSLPHPCVPVEANEPLYILYTSGTTGNMMFLNVQSILGSEEIIAHPQPFPNPNSRTLFYLDQPKGILRPVGGHIATLAWTMHTIYGMNKDDVWWTASDMGWVVGHSYICYGPLCYGITSVMYEGKPDRTPDPGQYFRLIHEHKVNGLLTAPTALRVIKREDPEITKGRKYSTKTSRGPGLDPRHLNISVKQYVRNSVNSASLRNLFVAGEHCDHETKFWAEKVFNVPILNHWWQTETGHSITASCIGLNHSTSPPKFSAGMPFPGYDVRILRSNGSEADIGELGRIVGYYDTMDAGYRDDFGYIYVTARDDDVINVAGHRLSTAALEDVVMSHPDIGDAAVIGVPESTKGEIPLCLFIMKKGARKSEKAISHELVLMVRELIGPIAAFRLSAAVSGLPRTRSGKIARKSIADLARSKSVKIPSTIEDPSVYKNIKEVLQSFGFAKNAPDPK